MTTLITKELADFLMETVAPIITLISFILLIIGAIIGKNVDALWFVAKMIFNLIEHLVKFIIKMVTKAVFNWLRSLARTEGFIITTVMVVIEAIALHTSIIAFMLVSTIIIGLFAACERKY